MAHDIAKQIAALKAHHDVTKAEPVIELFAADPERFAKFHVAIDDLLFDYSKQRVTGETMKLLFDLAAAAGLEQRRAALFAGETVNPTEHRAALHMALRNVSGKPMKAQGQDVMPDVIAVRDRMGEFAEAIRSGTIKGASGKPFTDIVNIGIGGSDLGPAMAARALSPYVQKGLSLHFVSNVDGADLGDVLKVVPLETTLFIVCSKTFTTLETMTNAQSARKAVAAKLGETAVIDHFAAVSTQLDKIAEFGIAEDRVFGFWDWVGGRYSVWSAIGLSVMIGIGRDNFHEFLAGGQDIDEHFVSAPLEKNIPALMGLIEVWNHNILDYATQAVIPYDNRLARFPAYLQQLEMESNGKHTQLDGSEADMATSPIIFGEPGTNGQHAFFQMLHQGTEPVPIDFLLAAKPTDADQHHHDLLAANCFAQGEALMRGRTLDEVKTLLKKQGLDDAAIASLAPHKTFEGSRPTSTFLYTSLTPRALGRLIALYEHKVFTMGVIWNIGSFDQWGVELGKELAGRLVPIVSDKTKSTADLDSSTAGLIEGMRRLAAS
ncbi:glucosephosphate isomerase [Beijerinckiaceae bacterium RH AL1]|nr:glucose-6-phosphate isomerase [Beijerinckiaceae bacterium]VVB42219.1 glucosephosphate isomerase [Beijerinckiaceae bacterium RH AL8]VVB42220.1 glucosephosphate isomerase [Beijerinckiaceae bacterium RH CH11]VVC53198.1 glucosephosphate isomerase [Beijerinckiaceae bacterium RH AL1]